MEQTKETDNQSVEDSGDEMDYNNSDLIKCRYYRNKLPEKDEVVHVVTTDVKELGAYV